MKAEKNVIIYVVDDELSFLNVFSEFEIDHSKILTFSDPMKAIEYFKSEPPNIIISDVMMPGMNGMAFKIVAEEFMKPNEIIIVSANPLNDVEKLGQLNEKLFYQKPLNQEFYSHLEKMVGEIYLKIQNENRNESSKQDLAPKKDQIEKLFEEWKTLEDYVYISLKNNNYWLAFEDYVYDTVDKYSHSIDGAVEILGIGKSSLHKIFETFENKHPSASKRINDDLLRIPNEKFLLKYPFIWSNDYFKIHDKVINTFEYKALKDKVEFFINDEKFIKAKNEGKYFNIKADTVKNLFAYIYFQNLKMSFLESVKMVKAALLYPESKMYRKNMQYKLQIDPPIRLDDGSLLVELRKDGLDSSFDNQFVKLNEARNRTQKKEMIHSFEFTKFPSKAEVTSLDTVELIIQSEYEIEVFYKRKKVKIPIHEIVQDHISRGFTFKNTVYYRTLFVISFAWDIAFQQNVWNINGKKVILDDLF